MAKYSQGFKLKIVQEYLKGNLGYVLLAQKYGIPSPTPNIGLGLINCINITLTLRGNYPTSVSYFFGQCHNKAIFFHK
ncbi:hypothetical protein [Viridibacillus arvi]|uniref:hypothetical protein n=1 Tax=Viridibacillus arvi TaxID=263475 RepID=UPI003D2E3977